jgi:RNA polymerase sigma-70 factor (ECF subfamily)
MESPRGKPVEFVSTRWSLVAGSATLGADGRRALGELCELYWYPLYAFVRRQGFARDHAEDLVQDFFRLLIERNDFAGLDASRGRFRAFLSAALRHFLSNERDRVRAQKRGGGQTTLSIDAARAERRYLAEPATAATAEQEFERAFALELIDRCLGELGEEWRRAGRAADFDRLSALLTPGADESYETVGAALDMSESAVKMAVHRLRRRLAALVRREIRDVVSDDAEVESEIRHLFVVVGARASPFSGDSE